MTEGRRQGRRGARLGAVTTAAFALALASVSLNAAQGSPLTGIGPMKAQWPLVVLAVIVASAVLVGRFRVWQNRAASAGPVRGRIDSLVVPFVALAAVATVVAVALLGTHTPGQDQLPSPNQGNNSGPQNRPSVQQMPITQGSGTGVRYHLPFSLGTLLLIVLALVTVVLVVALAVALSRWLAGRSGPVRTEIAGAVVGEPEDEALAEAVSAGQRALAGTDARAAIIACYAAMEASLAAGGINRRRADTPAELLERVLQSGLVDEEPVRTLTELFSEARYSTHPMGEGRRDRAAAALDVVAARLAAAAAAAEEGGIHLPKEVGL